MKIKTKFSTLLFYSICMVFLLFHSMDMIGQVNDRGNLSPNFECTTEVICPPAFDLIIYNGLDGATGGQMIDDINEMEQGAITIANLNDTDGDMNMDNMDNVVIASPTGRDEVDLMRLDIIALPGGDEDCNLNVTLNVQSGQVSFWELTTKGNIILNPSFSTQDLPQTIYVEATQPSNNARDIQIQLLFDNMIQDEVRATAIWVLHNVDNNNINVFAERGIPVNGVVPNGLPTNPVPGTNDIPFLDEAELIDYINSSQSTDNSRYGAGFHQLTDAIEGLDNLHGGRILMEFEIIPQDIGNLPIFFDIGRRKSRESGGIANGFVNIVTEQEMFLPQVELSNDDRNQDDEDRIPNDRKIYSFDAPGRIVCDV